MGFFALFPTRVGVILLRRLPECHPISLPHVSGGNPDSMSSRMTAFLPPHEWGNPNCRLNGFSVLASSPHEWGG